MTRDTTRPADGGYSHGSGGDVDVLAGLWEEARLARLPWDAPPELIDLVDEIDNPKRVYAIHKASRRHGFQLLVQRRIAAGAPVRRFNTTSARTLATFLASQDNPEGALCPNLRSPKAPPAAISSLVLVPGPRPPLRDDNGRVVPTKSNGVGLRASIVKLQNGTQTSSAASSGKPSRPATPPEERQPERPVTPVEEDRIQKQYRRHGFAVTEEPVSKDYRSFAANVFGTVAFKMLEWLTPAAIETLAQKLQNLQATTDDDNGISDHADCKLAAESHPSLSPQDSNQEQPVIAAELGEELAKEDASAIRAKGTHNNDSKESQPDENLRRSEQPQAPRSGAQRRNSNAKVRRPSGPKPKRQLSIDPFVAESPVDEALAVLRSPRANGGPTERNPRTVKTSGSTLPRPISQLSSAGFFDDVSLEKMPPLKPVDHAPKIGRTQMDGTRSSDSTSPRETVAASTPPGRSSTASSTRVGDIESDSDDDSQYPQSLSRLSAEVIDFICDAIQEDGTAEQHLLEPPSITRFHNKYSAQQKTTKRKSRTGRASSTHLKREWKLFAEQSLFYVLSDPQLVLRSFSAKGQLYDSQTLWYCMLRMTRIAPTLVFHSLWMAASSLFAPPKSLQALRSPSARLFPKHESPLSNTEAGRLVSICLHALVAAAPLVTDPRQLYDVSRIRSHGLNLAGSGAVAQQSAELCLQYEDAFTDDLALRLARRLFAAITARCCYDDMNDSNLENDEMGEPDVLAPLFSQLDFLNMDAVYVLNFSFPDRALHETRVPILLLDWARAVMLHDWNGSPEIRGDAPFGGALTFIEAMYKKRQELLLGDAQFRSEYFAERLDPVSMPIAWLSHAPSRQKMHLLDFPYMFNPATLVSYFRSINFSRMSRSYEESTSLQERIEVIASRSNLTHHHKEVLTNRLRTAAAKYLVLDISRERLLKDAFDQLWRREERELLRPLKVHLGELNGEEGFDSGGVQQEFFRLAIAEALNPKYGGFTIDERSRMTWFVPGSMEADWKFELIGLLVSLAVYNGVTLPVTFPKALYRKLLGEPVTEVHHIADGWPELASGLTSLLEWDEKDGLIEDVFSRTYEFSVNVAGTHITREMKPAGTAPSGEGWPQFAKPGANNLKSHPAPHAGNPAEDDAPLVTNANRNAYVSDYIRYLTDVSVRRQYESFARGFRTCLHPKSLSLLTPPLLQSVVEGVQDIDIGELRRHARYVGWDAYHRSIKDFWSIVKRFDDDMKRKLLEFVTASDRVPVGGIKNMMFIVQRNGEEVGPHPRLPTTYTCYGILLLPVYRDKDTMRERLTMALNNAQGFGFA